MRLASRPSPPVYRGDARMPIGERSPRKADNGHSRDAAVPSIRPGPRPKVEGWSNPPESPKGSPHAYDVEPVLGRAAIAMDAGHVNAIGHSN